MCYGKSELVARVGIYPRKLRTRAEPSANPTRECLSRSEQHRTDAREIKRRHKGNQASLPSESHFRIWEPENGKVKQKKRQNGWLIQRPAIPAKVAGEGRTDKWTGSNHAFPVPIADGVLRDNAPMHKTPPPNYSSVRVGSGEKQDSPGPLGAERVFKEMVPSRWTRQRTGWEKHRFSGEWPAKRSSLKEKDAASRRLRGAGVITKPGGCIGQRKGENEQLSRKCKDAMESLKIVKIHRKRCPFFPGSASGVSTSIT